MTEQTKPETEGDPSSDAKGSALAGYRNLSHNELDAANAIKRAAAQLGSLLRFFEHDGGVDQRALAIAITSLQTTEMWAVRAITKPEVLW